MTATERRFQGSSDDVVSMDDPALYGDTFELLTFRDAIAATPPILSDYRILTIGVRESDVARLVEQNRWLDKKLKRRPTRTISRKPDECTADRHRALHPPNQASRRLWPTTGSHHAATDGKGR